MHRDFGVVIAKSGVEGPDFLVLSLPEKEVICEAYLRDLHPQVSPALTYQLQAIIEEQVWRAVSEVATTSEQVLRQTGYL